MYATYLRGEISMVKVDGCNVPEGFYYSKEYEWAKVEGDKIRVGITDFAQKQLREIVYVEIPEGGASLKQNEPYGTVESVKSVSDLVAPISGTVEQVNQEVTGKPELLNEDPYSKGWLLIIKPSNMDELKNLMDATKAVEWYKSLLKEAK